MTDFSGLTQRTARVGTDEIAVQPTGDVPPQRIEVDTLLDGVGGVPDGGTTGQLLAKQTNTDGDVIWKTIAGPASWAQAGDTSAIPDNKIPASIARDSEVTAAVGAVLQLPAYPSAGSRDNKVPKFSGDTLGWEVDADTDTILALATNTDIDGETENTKAISVKGTYRAIGRKVKTATNTVIGIVKLASLPEARAGTATNAATTPQGVTERIKQTDAWGLLGGKPNIPNTPNAPAAAGSDKEYNLKVTSAGAVSYAEDTGGGTGLPTFPSAGSRDNKVPKFAGDTLGWELDAEGAASGGSVKGDHWATLSLGAGTSGATAVTVTAEGTAAGFSVAGNNQQLLYPQNPDIAPEGTLGFWVQSWVGGDQKDEGFLPWGPGAVNADSIRLKTTDSATINVIQVNYFGAAVIAILRHGANASFPASEVRVLAAGAGGGTSSSGDGTDQTARDAAAAAQADADVAWKYRGTWSGAGVDYKAWDIVTLTNPPLQFYICREDHTSQSDAAKFLDQDYWVEIPTEFNTRLLPALPAGGSRDNKVLKFDVDTLGWEVDAGGTTDVISDETLTGSGASAANPLSVAYPFTADILIGLEGDIANVVDYQDYTGDWSAKAYTNGQVAKASDGNYYQAKRDLANTVAEPTADTADWKLLATLAKSTAQFHEYLVNLGAGGTGAVRFMQVDSEFTVSSTQATNLSAIADLNDLFVVELEYDRTSTNLHMWTLLKKSDIPTSGVYELQLQGAGGAHVGFAENGANELSVETTGAAGIANITCRLFNMVAPAGPKGDKGDGVTSPDGASRLLPSPDDLPSNKWLTTVGGAWVVSDAPSGGAGGGNASHADQHEWSVTTDKYTEPDGDPIIVPEHGLLIISGSFDVVSPGSESGPISQNFITIDTLRNEVDVTTNTTVAQSHTNRRIGSFDIGANTLRYFLIGLTSDNHLVLGVDERISGSSDWDVDFTLDVVVVASGSADAAEALITRMADYHLWKGAFTVEELGNLPVALTAGQEIRNIGVYYRLKIDAPVGTNAYTTTYIETLSGADLAIAKFHENLYEDNLAKGIFRPWKYVEPTGGLPDLEIDSADAASGVVETITGAVDSDRELVTSIHAAQAAGIETELHITGTVKYYFKQNAPLSDASGAILSTHLWLQADNPIDPRTGVLVSTHAAPTPYLLRLDTNTLTLADFRNSHGGRSAFGSTPDLTKQFSFTLTETDFHNWHLQDGEELNFLLYGNNINGGASIKAEIDDVVISYDRKEVVIPETPEPLRYRAVVSDDSRTTTEKYQIEYGGDSYTVQHSASRVNTFKPSHPNLPTGYDSTKVNLVYDGGDHQFNPSGVDFTAESAGSTTRTIKCTLEIAPDPSQERSNNDVLNLVIRGYNRARINGSASITKRLAFANSQTYPFKVHFNLTYTAAPRSGIQDSLVFTLQSDISRIKVIPKLTYYLPFTGASLPTQKYDQPGTSGHVTLSSTSAAEFAAIVPEDLTKALAGGRIGKWEIPSGSANNEGRNDPTEEDHSDSVRAALGSHGNVFIEAAQDLSQLHLTLKDKAQVNAGSSYSIYLCTYLRGVLKPTVVAHGTMPAGVSTPPAWSIDYTAKGVLKGQRFYLLSTGVIGDAEMIWDATLQDTIKTVTVKKGFTTTREVVLGSAANTHTLGNIVNLPPVETWVKLRFFSSGLITTVDWPENYLEGFPTTAGQPSLTHKAIGPLSAHDTGAGGTIVHNRYIVPWQDGADWKLSVYSGSSLNSVWLDKIEIEYELLN